MVRAARWVAVGMIAAVVAGCGEPRELVGTATAAVWTDTPIPSETATATSTPVVTPAVASTPSETPTRTPTPIEVFAVLQDGQHTVYIKNDQVCALDERGAPVFITGLSPTVGNVHPSPDGRRVIFFKGLERAPDENGPHWYELWSVRPDGSDLKRVVNLPDLPAFQPGGASPLGSDTAEFTNRVWIPGTHKLAFTTGILDRSIYVDFARDRFQNDLYIVDVETGEVQNLLPAGSGGASIFPSPDGRSIAMITRGAFHLEFNAMFADILSPDSISLIGVDGSNWQHSTVSYNGVIIPLNNGYIYYDPDVVWSPDSSGVQVAVLSDNPRQAGRIDIEGWFIPPSGDAQLRYHVRNVDLNIYEQWDVYPSADGRYFAFVGDYDERVGLHIFDTRTSKDSVYFENKVTHFIRWEADSRHFAVAASPPDDSFTLVLQRGSVDGGFAPVDKPESPRIELPDCAP